MPTIVSVPSYSVISGLGADGLIFEANVICQKVRYPRAYICGKSTSRVFVVNSSRGLFAPFTPHLKQESTKVVRVFKGAMFVLDMVRCSEGGPAQGMSGLV